MVVFVIAFVNSTLLLLFLHWPPTSIDFPEDMRLILNLGSWKSITLVKCPSFKDNFVDIILPFGLSIFVGDSYFSECAKDGWYSFIASLPPPKLFVNYSGGLWFLPLLLNVLALTILFLFMYKFYFWCMDSDFWIS